MQRLLLKGALLSVSLVLTATSSIAICLPTFSQMYPVEQSSIELLIPIPSLAVMIMMLLTDKISSVIGKKRTVQLGLIIIAVSAFISASAFNYEIMLLSRIILGVGLGLCNALAVSLIAEFFTGDECATMMGIRNACEGLGQSILTFIAGLLFLLSWRNVFFIYLAAIPILLLFSAFVPNDKPRAKEEKAAEDAQTQKSSFALPWHAIPHCFVCLLAVLVLVGFFIKLFPMASLKGIDAAPEKLNNVMAILSFTSMIGGCLFGLFFSKLKFFSFPASLVLTACACFWVSVAESYGSLLCSYILYGFCYPLVISYLFNMIGTLSTGKFSATVVTSWLIIGCNLGGILSPFVFNFITNITGSVVMTTFDIFGVVFLIIAAISFILKSRFVVNNGEANADANA